MNPTLARFTSPRALLSRLIENPELPTLLRELPPPTFSTLIREIGVEDAGELLALATTEQLVTAFDEDLFVSDRPAERERLDPARFSLWLEVLLEAGDAAAAKRITELSEDFVVHALSTLIRVFDQDELRERINDEEDEDSALSADKALESALSEEIDGYLVVARRHEGWDAVISLVLALDRDHRDFLVRVLDRCVQISSELLEDLDELSDALSEADSLAEDVEGEREERRAALGYVEPRAARAFLTLAREPIEGALADVPRDAITHAYFRELAPMSRRVEAAGSRSEWIEAVREASSETTLALGDGGAGDAGSAELARVGGGAGVDADTPVLVQALRLLAEEDLQAYDARVEELSYLANVVIAGLADEHGGRYGVREAAAKAIEVVTRGAELEARPKKGASATPAQLMGVLRKCSVDRLFRRGWAKDR